MFKQTRSIAMWFVCMALFAQAAPAEIGVVVIHGKGGNPGRFVDILAAAFERAGFQVANLEMPWSKHREYDVNMSAAAGEISRALEAMRARGARKVFVTGHSQGGLFAVHYAGVQRVDGVVPIAPGGAVDASAYLQHLGAHVQQAREMVAAGRGAEKAEFADYEGSRGTNTINTTAATYLDWFDPEGAHTSRAFAQVRPGTPVLYVAPARDYPGLIKLKQQYFHALPPHPKTRLYEPDSDHLNAPAAAAEEAIRWINEVAADKPG